ncbi:unnamed protein product [Rhizophagus irregularis]|nr:unnamed protein product [Rhizophagus irregularis]
MEELETVIKNLKSNKAPGMSGISYDFWKKSKKPDTTDTSSIINEKHGEGNATEKWKRGLIYPINKTTRSHWNQDLSLTEAIIQITPHSKNESTLEPIKIIQHIIEDANRNGKGSMDFNSWTSQRRMILLNTNARIKYEKD